MVLRRTLTLPRGETVILINPINTLKYHSQNQRCVKVSLNIEKNILQIRKVIFMCYICTSLKIKISLGFLTNKNERKLYQIQELLQGINDVDLLFSYVT